jgi:hypothetical protein
MTDSLLRRTHHVLAPVQRRDVMPALEMCAIDPVAHVVPAMQLERAKQTGFIPPGLWAVKRRAGLSKELAGVVWNGANFTALLPTDSADAADTARAELASASIARLTRPAALVGESTLTLDMWGRLEPWWGPARETRECQVSMSIDTSPKHVRAIDAPQLDLDAVHAATMPDFPFLLPACVHMFKGEVGYDPMLHGRAAYEERLTQLVRGGRSYLQYGTVAGLRQVVFKAEVGALGGGVAQLQGVWVHPELRGQGLARAGLAAVIEAVRATTAPVVSLYVNDFNTTAIAAYEAVGFQRVGTFATVML